MPQIKKIRNSFLENDISNKDILKTIENVSSYNKTKKYNKIDYQDIMPPMTCKVELVRKFRKQAKDKKWSYTTLMNEILTDWFNKGE